MHGARPQCAPTAPGRRHRPPRGPQDYDCAPMPATVPALLLAVRWSVPAGVRARQFVAPPAHACARPTPRRRTLPSIDHETARHLGVIVTVRIVYAHGARR